jgi:hypothetical protein
MRLRHLRLLAGLVPALALAGCEGSPTSAAAASGPLAQTSPSAVPAPPVGGTATLTPERHVRIAWTHDGASTGEYRVYRRLYGSTDEWTLVTWGASSPLHENMLPLDATVGRSYLYRIYACNAAGCSAPNEISTWIPALEAPSNLVAQAEPWSVVLTWQDNSSSETHYQVAWTTSTGETGTYRTAANTTRLAFGATPGVTYTFRVRALLEPQWQEPPFYSAWSAEASAVAYAAPPHAPYDGALSYSSASHAVNISWQHDNIGSVREYLVDRKVYGSSGDWERIAYRDRTQFTYMDHLPASATGVSYLYRVYACNSSGCSAPNELSIWTPPASW